MTDQDDEELYESKSKSQYIAPRDAISSLMRYTNHVQTQWESTILCSGGKTPPEKTSSAWVCRLSIEVCNFYDKWWTIHLYKQNAIEIFVYDTSREEDTGYGKEEELVDGEEEEEPGGDKEEELHGNSIVTTCTENDEPLTIN